MWVWQHCLIDSAKRKRILLPPSATVTGTSSLSDSICSLSPTSASPKLQNRGIARKECTWEDQSGDFLSGLITDVKLLFGLALFLLAERFFGRGVGCAALPRLTGRCKPQLRGVRGLNAGLPKAGLPGPLVHLGMGVGSPATHKLKIFSKPLVALIPILAPLLCPSLWKRGISWLSLMDQRVACLFQQPNSGNGHCRENARNITMAS